MLFYLIPLVIAILAYLYFHRYNAKPKKIPLSVNYHLTRQCNYVRPFHIPSVFRILSFLVGTFSYRIHADMGVLIEMRVLFPHSNQRLRSSSRRCQEGNGSPCCGRHEKGQLCRSKSVSLLSSDPRESGHISHQREVTVHFSNI